MGDFIVLIGQIFLIALIQIIMEAFMDTNKKPYQAMIINIACFLGSLYLLLDFVFNKLLKDITGIIQVPFR